MATTLAVFGGLLVLDLVLYRGLWNNQWYQDDFLWLRIARDIAQSPQMLFAPDVHNSEAVLRLTQRAVMAITYAFARLDAAPYHVVSLVLHAAAATAVFWLLRALLHRFDPPSNPVGWALMGAVIFAGSSNHDVAVLWVAAQSTLLATTFAVLLLTLLIERQQQWHRRSTWALAASLFLLAVFSKNTAVTLPLAVAVYVALGKGEQRRAGWILAATLGVWAIVHLIATKAILPAWLGQIAAITDHGQFAASGTTVLNVLGALLGAFMSARTYALLPVPVPFAVVAVLLMSVLLSGAVRLGVLRPVALGLAWIAVFALPTALFDYRQYDASQLTVSRYQHLPAVGAVVATVFLSRAVWTRLGRRLPVALVIAALVALDVGFHQRMLQKDLRVLRTWGDTEKSFIDRTLERAATSIPPGTTIYAVRWKTADAYLSCIDELYFAGRGYSFEGMAAFDRLRAAPDSTLPLPPWVAAYDPAGQRFGVMPLARFLELETTTQSR